MFSMRPRKANCSSFCVMLLPLPSSDMLVFILYGNKKQILLSSVTFIR
jgi:hypothetical protein